MKPWDANFPWNVTSLAPKRSKSQALSTECGSKILNFLNLNSVIIWPHATKKWVTYRAQIFIIIGLSKSAQTMPKHCTANVSSLRPRVNIPRLFQYRSSVRKDLATKMNQRIINKLYHTSQKLQRDANLAYQLKKSKRMRIWKLRLMRNSMLPLKKMTKFAEWTTCLKRHFLVLTWMSQVKMIKMTRLTTM